LPWRFDFGLDDFGFAGGSLGAAGAAGEAGVSAEGCAARSGGGEMVGSAGGRPPASAPSAPSPPSPLGGAGVGRVAVRVLDVAEPAARRWRLAARLVGAADSGFATAAATGAPAVAGSGSPSIPGGNAGMRPPYSWSISRRRRMYVFSRSFHSTSTGVAMKIDE
jgi:hypothetical protein